ncbi:hypothetical protein KGF56_001287 [Candida oxycetoniae]|uniref:Altered inheritance of mitochondria protein 19, mitochondrial n=1 Tax=Candida oxycetoniae TaxID=497107 RepID=A0AAI9WZD0_9ASCO|nr:uncharacterized protein KGF56_001287 [Candida oxycetoniae]KAI3406068.2 hypothetical protein KGF56_001287 [Candida oxycetoniae]
MSNSVAPPVSESTSNNVWSKLDELSLSPIPSGVLSAALLLKALKKSVGTTEIPYKGTSGSSYALHKSIVAAKPTRISCAFFGGALALGTFMMIDGDPLNASGFNFAWSTLYLFVNGKAAASSFFKGRMTPVALGSLALFDAALYGREFFWSKNSPFQN